MNLALPIKLFIFSLIISSKTCFAADYQYEACVPTSCGSGPNISFPFYVPTIQESYCGYPRFEISCKTGVPILQLSENDENEYVVEEIFYHNQTVRVFNALALSLEGSDCPPRIRNTTLPAGRFDYVNGTSLHLLSDCRNNVSEELSRYEVRCGSSRETINGTLGMSDGDRNLGKALENCAENIVAPVEILGGGREDGGMDVAEVLRRGFAMNWVDSGCNACRESGGRCGFNETSFHFRCFCPDRPHSRSCKPDNDRWKLIIAICIPIAVVLLLLVAIFILWQRKKRLGGTYLLSRNSSSDPSSNSYIWGNHAKAKDGHEKDIELFLMNNGNLAPRRYKSSSIKKITNSFGENLGRGGFGSVYKGQLPDGHLVAVKVLNESNGNGEDFMNEVASISRTSHINIVTLLGFCFEGSKRALIYDFMPNGSLEKFIGNNVAESVLGWDKLFEIALGIARGLEYLHQGCNTRILHLDIKPQNILLDKDLSPRISDFGLAKLCPNRSSMVSMMVARGTIGYIAPEVFSRNFGEVSYKSDVYSYGMLVLEMAGGRRTVDRRDVDRTSEIYFPHFIYKELEEDAHRDSDFVGTVSEDGSLEVKRNLMIVGLWCIQTNPKDRPSMTKVVEMLEGKLGALEVPPQPYSPPRSAPSFSTSESF